MAHIKAIHEGLKYDCNKCDYRANKKNNLIAHKKSKHDRFRYDCNHSESTFTLQGSLTTHI